MNKWYNAAGLALLALVCGCSDSEGVAEKLLEKEFGTDVTVLTVRERVQDVGKTRERWITVIYQLGETLYEKRPILDAVAVSPLITPQTKLAATIVRRRGKGAHDPVISELIEERTVSMRFSLAKSSENPSRGLLWEHELEALKGSVLVEGTEEYLAYERAEKAQKEQREREEELRRQREKIAQAEARRQQELARQKAEAEAAARAAAEAKAKADAEAEALRTRIENMVNAGLASSGGGEGHFTVMKVHSAAGKNATFEGKFSIPLYQTVMSGTRWVDGDTIVQRLPDVTILRETVPAGTVVTCDGTMTSNTAMRVKPRVNGAVAKSLVNNYKVGLIEGTPAYEEYVAFARRAATVIRRIEADKVRIKEAKNEYNVARREKNKYRQNRLKEEQEELDARCDRNNDAYKAAFAHCSELYKAQKGRILQEPLGLNVQFGDVSATTSSGGSGDSEATLGDLLNIFSS